MSSRQVLSASVQGLVSYPPPTNRRLQRNGGVNSNNTLSDSGARSAGTKPRFICFKASYWKDVRD